MRGFNANKDGCNTIYVKDEEKAFRKRVNTGVKDDIKVRPKGENDLPRAALRRVTTKYIQVCYKEVKKAVMGSRVSGKVCIEKSGGNAEPFVGFIQLFSVKWRRCFKVCTSSVFCTSYISENAC